MRIQHASVAPLNPDTLIAIHVIADFMDRMEDEGGSGKGVEPTQEFLVFQSLFLEDLLWGSISFGTPVRSVGEQYASLKNPPMGDVLKIVHERGLDTLKCIINLSSEEMRLYEKSPAFKYIIRKDWMRDEEGAKVWQELKERPADFVRIALPPLRECYSLCSAILDAREMEFEEAVVQVNDPDGSDHTKMLQLCQSKPMRLDFRQVEYKRVRDVLWTVEREYLEAFMSDRIRWLENTPKWQWQKEKVLPVLQERAKQFAHFWVGIADPEFHESHAVGHDEYYLSCSCKLVETLLALSFEQTIDILEIAPASDSLIDDSHTKTDLRFRVKFHEKSADRKTLAAGTKAAKPVLTLIRNDRLGVVTINGEYLVTPQSGTPGDRLLTELLQRNKAERVVKLSDADIHVIKGTVKTPISNILTNLGFKGDLRTAFFPTSSNSAVVFVNPVFEADLQEHGITRIPVVRKVVRRRKK